jgi:anti-sigma regulatory factor (Ser/Thr protein kinase)
MSFDTAELYFQKAEDIYAKSGCGDSIFLTVYKYQALLFYTKSEFGKAQEYSFNLLRAAEANGSPHEIGVTYTMIAQVFNQTGQAEKGVVYTRKAVPYLVQIKDPANTADLLSKLSKRFLWHFQDTKIKSSLDTAEIFCLQQLAIAKKINRRIFIASAYNSLEGIYWERNDFKKALEYSDSSFRYTEKDDYQTLATNYYDKSELYIESDNILAAERMADSALYYNRLNGNPVYIAGVYDLKARIFTLKNDYKNAYQFKEKGRKIQDSLRNIEKVKQVTELERKYSQAKNEKTIVELAQQRRIYLLLAVAALLGLGLLGFIIRQQALKHKQKILETEQRLNRARMNPHFFFNALASLQSFALQGNDGKLIAGNLSKFSHIMRETLESTYKEYITIEQETDFLNEYMELQKLRFPKKFTCSIACAETLDPEETLLPAMILQPFVENSIEHGFSGIDYAGQITIRFEKKGSQLQICITDNGKGLASFAKEPNEHISRASQIIRDRIYLLNLKLKTKAAFTISNNHDGLPLQGNLPNHGVTVQILLPLLWKHEIQP